MLLNEKIQIWLKKWMPIVILLLTAVTGTIATLIASSNEAIFLYSDTLTHLIIARRVFDSVTPGLAQLGGTWLPLQHFSMFPVVWSDILWRTPLSSYLPNILFLCGMTLSFYFLAYKQTQNAFVSLVAGLVPLSNANILYMQALPMFEMPFLSLLSLFILFSFFWIRKNGSIPLLITAGFFVSLLSLTRYEGWILAFGSIMAVMLTVLITRNRKKAEGMTVIYATIALTGIMLWLGWQLLIFGNPFYFLQSPYSAENNARLAVESGSAITYQDLPLSIISMVYASIYNNGIFIHIAFIISLLTFLIQVIKKKEWKELLIKTVWIVLFLSPVMFDIYSVYSGKVPIYIPELTGSDFNIRFGLYAFPGLLAALIILPTGKRIIGALVLLVFLASIAFSFLNQPTTYRAALGEGGSKDQIRKAGDIVEGRKNQGKIMVSGTNLGVALMYHSNINLVNFITDSNYRIWEEAIQEPNKYVGTIIVTKSEAEEHREFVQNQVVSDQEKMADFQLLFENDYYAIYGRR